MEERLAIKIENPVEGALPSFYYVAMLVSIVFILLTLGLFVVEFFNIPLDLPEIIKLS